MKKIIIILVFFLSCIVNVSASTINSVSITNELLSGGQEGFLRSGYPATVHYNNKDVASVGFCLDPGLSLPTSLTNINKADNNYYYPYLFFYNNVMYSPSNYNSQRVFFLAAVRSMNYQTNVDYVSCMKGIKDSTPDASCYSDEQYELIAKYYRASSNKDMNNWAKTFKEPKIIFSKQEKIDDKFSNLIFDFNWANLLNKDSFKQVTIADNGAKIEAPYLNVKRVIIKHNENILFDSTNASISGYVTNYSFNPETGIIDIRMDVSAIKALSGSIKLIFDYEWSHPLNPNNLYLAKKIDENYQRMLIITNKIETEKKEFELEPDNMSFEEINYNNLCVQEGDSFYYNNKKIELGEFITNCGCGLVDSSKLYDLSEYDSKCSLKIDSYYNSDFGYCKVDNKITREADGNINNYCKFELEETLEFKNFFAEDSLILKSGQTFKTNKSDSLALGVNANYTIYYTTAGMNNLKNDIEKTITELVNSYNMWQKTIAVDNSSFERNVCCGYTITEDGVRTCVGTTGELRSYSYEYYVQNGLSLSTDRYNGTYRTCSTIPTTDENADERFIEYLGKLDSIESQYSSCNTLVSGVENSLSQYTEENVKMIFMYQQQNSKGKLFYNNERTHNIDDSKLTTKVINSDTTPITGDIDLKYDSINYDKGIAKTENVDVKLNHIERTDEVSFEFNPIFKKTISNNINIKIESESDEKKYNIDNLYDIDATAIAKKDNKSYYTFEKLGSDYEIGGTFIPSIFNYFNEKDDNKNVDYNNSINEITRPCNFKTKNDLFTTCITGCCDDSCPEFKCEGDECDSKLNLVYRSVDPSNIDPNNRLCTKNPEVCTVTGFKNWDTATGKLVKDKIEQDAKGNNTYNPENLEYSFTLDSKVIQEIRSYNDEKKYDDFSLKCTEGNKCESSFINFANQINGINGGFETKFGNNYNGRNTWKEIDLTNRTIDGKEVK